MRKYYLSHIDFSELVNVTADEEQLGSARERMTELKLLTEKGNLENGSSFSYSIPPSWALFVTTSKTDA